MSEAATIERTVRASHEVRRARARRLLLAFALWVGVPTLLAALYFGLVATPQYESIAVLAVDTGQPLESAKKGSPTEGAGIYLVREHILSRPLVEKLAREQKLGEHFADPEVDWWSRLGRGAGGNALHEYYLQKVAAAPDAKGATLTLSVRAFSAVSAAEFARAIVASAEEMVKATSARVRQSVMQAAEQRVAEAEQRLAKARGAGPAEPAGGADVRANLEIELAGEQLRAALRALELVEVEVARRQQYVVVVAPPSLPDRPSYPRRLWSIATVFCVAAAATGILGLLGIAVREHAQL